VSRLRFIDAEKAAFPVALLCRVLDVSRSTYYAWRCRGPSARAQDDARLIVEIHAAYAASRATYGVPRIHADLRDQGTRIGRKRVWRLMRVLGIAGCSPRRKRVCTTIADPTATPAPNVVARDFTVTEPNRLWVGDITYLPTKEGWLYLATVLDVFSRRIVGWAVADHLRTSLPLEALTTALAARQPAAGTLVHHTDRGSQYTSTAYRTLLAERGITASMSRKGDCYDNAMAESFFGTIKTELVPDGGWVTKAAARLAVFDYLEGFYNRQRRHSALGYRSPVTFEIAQLASWAA
jgi:transposase InsO family protein